MCSLLLDENAIQFLPGRSSPATATACYFVEDLMRDKEKSLRKSKDRRDSSSSATLVGFKPYYQPRPSLTDGSICQDPHQDTLNNSNNISQRQENQNV